MSATHRELEVSNESALRRGFITSEGNIAGQQALRPDPKYRFFWDLEHGVVLPHATMPQVRLGDCLLPFVSKFIPKGELGETRRILELADVEAYTSIILLEEEQERTVSVVGSTKLDFDGCDLVITRLRPYLGKVVLNDLTDPFIGTSEWIPLKLRTTHLDPLFAKYLLLLPEYRITFGRMMAGKEHPRIREEQLVRIRIPLPPLQAQLEAAKHIQEIEQKLLARYRSLPQFVTVIDTIFADVLGYELNDFRSDHDSPMYQSDLQHLGGSLDLRGGVRFHKPKFARAEELLRRIEHCRFREAVIPPVRLGATIHPTTDYDDESEMYYISPAVIKTHTFNLDMAQTVSEDFYQKNVRHYGLKENDLVIARSGEGTIGKAALFIEDEESNTLCIHSDFTMRIHFNSRIIPEFGYYFCCSKLFQFQVERNKRGMGNMTNFFPSQLLTFWIACPSLSRQHDIIERIHSTLQSLQEQRTEITKLRDEIDSIILRVIIDVDQ